ncbi:MAG TPA: hypothetical protein VEV81_08995 [Pyrinomonadaceae bacterium]|nr:hypothetical protein [Pyrinomonadaceae bacterium]
MKKRLGLLAIICLLLGFAAGGFAVWLYFHAETQSDLSRNLDRKSLELSEQSESVKGTPEESKLMDESQRYYQDAAKLLDSAKNNRRFAVISGVGSLVLILLSVLLIFLNLRTKEADSI